MVGREADASSDLNHSLMPIGASSTVVGISLLTAEPLDSHVAEGHGVLVAGEAEVA